MRVTYGSLFAGYGGLEAGVSSVIGGELSWYAEFDKAPSAIMAHHHPDIPNLGDVTKVDWHSVPQVDVITGGSPCQDVSHAGKRLGMKAGTRSGLWASMCDAIDIIRPRLVVWENVRGALSAEADSTMEPCAGCVGDGDDGPVLRALGRVLGDLAELGMDARWYGLRAADVGAPHGRFRIFLFAQPTDADESGLEGLAHQARAAQAERRRHLESGAGGLDRGLTLLPTPAVNDMGAGKTPDAWDAWDAWTDRMKSKHGNGNGHGKSLEIEALRLLPTPVADNSRGLPSKTTDYASLANVAASLLPTPRATRGGSHSETRDLLLPTPRATDGTKGGPNQRGSSGDLMLPSAVSQLIKKVDHADEAATSERSPVPGETVWGEYEAAVRRWEALTRLAPPPTEPGAKGRPRLSPAFVEWMQGLPEGHVTDPAIGISRNDQLKALGNGVVPQQAAAATCAWLTDIAKECVA